LRTLTKAHARATTTIFTEREERERKEKEEERDSPFSSLSCHIGRELFACY
jgi:hypothetical protein